MEVFNNRQRGGYEEISSYGPKFYRQVKEMDAIYRFAGWTADCMADSLEALISTQFVMNMPAGQLAFYERLFAIPVEGMALDARRRQVFADMFGNGKVSGSSIAAFAEILCGEGAEATVSMGSALEVRILSEKAGDAAHQQLMAYLGRTLPAHLPYSVIYEGYMKGVMYNGAVWHDTEIFELRQVV